MKMDEIRGMSDEDLGKHAAQAGEQLFRIRFQKSMGNLDGLKKMREHKLDVARVKTVERERTIAAERAAAPPVERKAPQPSQRTARKRAEKGN